MQRECQQSTAQDLLYRYHPHEGSSPADAIGTEIRRCGEQTSREKGDGEIEQE